MECRNKVLEVQTKPVDNMKTIITFLTQKFEVSFNYYYNLDNPEQIYNELLEENLFINRKEFFYYMQIFSKRVSRIQRVKIIFEV